ncbi:protein MARD1 [Vigna umbellata]|uniref:protein MARD1 n=1 Tax=Vigna umbellata TaxID=87088 RepID=UPI001F5E90DD|nr:protein MARD1 [Vigna umbellata]XP_047152164.1 protein MARD1 [Vigna umbellata]
MLLRNRSRAVSKPGLMADHSSQQSPSQNYAKTIPSLFGSPKFRDFTNKCLSSGTEALRSPTSILDARALSPFAFGNPFSTPPNKISPPSRTSWDKPDSKGLGLGLALVGAFKDDDNPIHDHSETNKGNVLLRVKIPFESQTCSDDFGTKTKESKNSSGSGSFAKDDCASTCVRALSWSEMELSEEYTCVISHGPNPKTTHIFNNCIVVETYYSLPQNQNSRSAASANFLSFCHTCKKHLDQTKDIFIYRGEKAFCSRECRHQEMVLDGIENLEFESNGFS